MLSKCWSWNILVLTSIISLYSPLHTGELNYKNSSQLLEFLENYLIYYTRWLWFYKENSKISTFYKITLVLSWSRQRMKHIYKSILDEMKSSYFKKWSILIISSFLSCISIVHCIFLYLNRKTCLTSLPRQEIFG